MKPGISDAEAIATVTAALSAWCKAAPEVEPGQGRLQVDAVVRVAGGIFLVEYISSSESVPVQRGLAMLRSAGEPYPGATLLLVVPHMGPVGAALSAQAGASWLDLSGNARIDAPGLVVDISGKPNLFVRPGRPSSPFAPKSSRVVRRLLAATEPLSQAQLSELTGLTDSFVSKIVRRLHDDRLVSKDSSGRLYVPDRKLIFTGWAAEYAFSKHELHQFGNGAASKVDIDAFASFCRREGVHHAFTGESAAHLLAGVGFSAVKAYVHPEDAHKLAGLGDNLGAGAVTVAIPVDEGVLQGAQEVDGLSVVVLVQALLDLDSASSTDARNCLDELAFYSSHTGQEHGN